jgi:hypothetical protein
MFIRYLMWFCAESTRHSCVRSACAQDGEGNAKTFRHRSRWLCHLFFRHLSLIDCPLNLHCPISRYLAQSKFMGEAKDWRMANLTFVWGIDRESCWSRNSFLWRPTGLLQWEFPGLLGARSDAFPLSVRWSSSISSDFCPADCTLPYIHRCNVFFDFEEDSGDVDELLEPQTKFSKSALKVRWSSWNPQASRPPKFDRELRGVFASRECVKWGQQDHVSVPPQ